MMNNTPSGMKKHRESTEPEICQMFFFPSSSSSSDGLVQNYTTHSRWFSCQTAAFYTEQCTSPSPFHNFKVTWKASNWSLKNYMASFVMPFSSLVHMQTNHLATKQLLLLFKIDELKNTVVYMETGRVFVIHCWLGVWTELSQWFFREYCYWGSQWGQTCWTVIVSKLQLKHAPTTELFMLSSRPRFPVFTDLLSLHLSRFQCFSILFLWYCDSIELLSSHNKINRCTLTYFSFVWGWRYTVREALVCFRVTLVEST